MVHASSLIVLLIILERSQGFFLRPRDYKRLFGFVPSVTDWFKNNDYAHESKRVIHHHSSNKHHGNKHNNQYLNNPHHHHSSNQQHNGHHHNAEHDQDHYEDLYNDYPPSPYFHGSDEDFYTPFETKQNEDYVRDCHHHGDDNVHPSYSSKYEDLPNKFDYNNHPTGEAEHKNRKTKHDHIGESQRHAQSGSNKKKNIKNNQKQIDLQNALEKILLQLKSRKEPVKGIVHVGPRHEKTNSLKLNEFRDDYRSTGIEDLHSEVVPSYHNEDSDDSYEAFVERYFPFLRSDTYFQ